MVQRGGLLLPGRFNVLIVDSKQVQLHINFIKQVVLKSSRNVEQIS